MMNILDDPDQPDKDKCPADQWVGPGEKDTWVQLVISLALGLSAFLAFCMLRPRWKSLYAARKRQSDPRIGLPTLPDSFFGWVPALYRITDQQLLASAGLDAYVFLAFFKMAMRLFAVMFFFAAVVLEPINRRFVEHPTTDSAPLFLFPQHQSYGLSALDDPTPPDEDPDISFDPKLGYLWSYLVFTYLFTGLTLYFTDKETLKVIRVRQNYLGTQSTITDRTFRLSGIPHNLRSEEAIKELIEKLEIGKVESVTLCRDWRVLDKLVEERRLVLAKLEQAWSMYLNRQPSNTAQRHHYERRPQHYLDEEAGEGDRLLEHRSPELNRTGETRPKARFWYGFLGLQFRTIDAIDYYSEKLRQLDDKILAARKKTYKPADLAFVTMDSVAACQMAIQALIDPHPDRLLTKPAPAPSDVVWRNTYSSRLSRITRSWAVTIFVAVLSVVWLVPVAFLASALSICTINTVFPSFAQWLKDHELARTLVQTGLPTAVVSLLNVAVPYFYEFLSYKQGMLSQGDIALSVISKNFFFTFFNIFLIFTVFGAVTSIFDVLRNSLKDTTYIAYTLARKIEKLSVFYTNFIMLQGLGLFPFRLLQFGSLALYPYNRFMAKTPRDFAALGKPSLFYYGLALPTALLVFILCLVYSALPGGYLILALGLAYFSLGHFTYKYQLLYAMDQPQHATGGAWPMICYRVMLGLVVTQLTMSGYLALRKAFTVALLVLPLFVATLWYGWCFRRRVEPLTKFISLRSIKKRENEGEEGVTIVTDDSSSGGSSEGMPILERSGQLVRRGSTVDEDRERGSKFVNPSLVSPLEQPWIYAEPPPALLPEGDDNNNVDEQDAPPPALGLRGYDLDNAVQFGLGSPSSLSVAAGPHRTSFRRGIMSSNSSSSVSLGDTHVWRE